MVYSITAFLVLSSIPVNIIIHDSNQYWYDGLFEIPDIMWLINECFWLDDVGQEAIICVDNKG